MQSENDISINELLKKMEDLLKFISEHTTSNPLNGIGGCQDKVTVKVVRDETQDINNNE